MTSDSVIVFRFVPRRLMFYSPYKGNETAIRQAARLLETHRTDIESGKARIRIRGFCSSYPTEKQNKAAAKNRTNQVKSYFITHLGMKEAHYHTSNHLEPYRNMHDIVALVGLEYMDGRPAPLVPAPPPPVEKPPVSFPVPAEKITELPLPHPASAAWIEDVSALPERTYCETPFALKTNLVYDALLTPSFELEYRMNPQWSVSADFSMPWWHNDGKHKYYQLFTAMPEARYWFSAPDGWHGHYVGALAGGTIYDLENGGRGYKGRGYMAGVTYGYMFPVGKHFALEAGLGIGFLHTRYEEYVPVDGHYAYQQTSQTNYFGPLKVKFSLVWRVGYWKRQKGGRP